MTETEFNKLAQQGYNRIPVVLETFADLDTPLSIYLKLANQPYSYLLVVVRSVRTNTSSVSLLAGHRLPQETWNTNSPPLTARNQGL